MKELRVGVIGCGEIGRDHIRRVSEVINGARVVAVSDIFEEVGSKVAEQYNAKYYKEAEELIASNDVDAVIIASVDDTHEKYVLASIKADKFVLCEKPLSPSISGCENIIKAEMAKNKKLVQVGFMRRYDQGYRDLKKLVQQRKYGEPIMIHCAHRNGELNDGFTTPMLISNCLTHEIDVLRWLLDENYVSCQVIIPRKTKHSRSDLQDPQILLLETQSGVRIDVEVFINCQYGYDIRCEVVSEDASISLPITSGVLTLNNRNRSLPITTSWKQRFSKAYDTEIQEWVDSTLKGVVSGPTAWDGYLCTYVASVCNRARETEDIVDIPEQKCPEFYK